MNISWTYGSLDPCQFTIAHQIPWIISRLIKKPNRTGLQGERASHDGLQSTKKVNYLICLFYHNTIKRFCCCKSDFVLHGDYHIVSSQAIDSWRLTRYLALSIYTSTLQTVWWPVRAILSSVYRFIYMKTHSTTTWLMCYICFAYVKDSCCTSWEWATDSNFKIYHIERKIGGSNPW